MSWEFFKEGKRHSDKETKKGKIENIGAMRDWEKLEVTKAMKYTKVIKKAQRK